MAGTAYLYNRYVYINGLLFDHAWLDQTYGTQLGADGQMRKENVHRTLAD